MPFSNSTDTPKSGDDTKSIPTGANSHSTEHRHVERPRDFCRVCRHRKPPAAKHCYICGHCVVKFDHHCPAVANCVGARNHFRFYSYVTVQTMLVSWAAYINIGSPGVEGDSQVLAILSVCLTIFLVLASLFTLSLWCFHSYLAVTGMTTYELISLDRKMLNSELRAPHRSSRTVSTSDNSTTHRDAKRFVKEDEQTVVQNLYAFWTGRVEQKFCVPPG